MVLHISFFSKMGVQYYKIIFFLSTTHINFSVTRTWKKLLKTFLQIVITRNIKKKILTKYTVQWTWSYQWYVLPFWFTYLPGKGFKLGFQKLVSKLKSSHISFDIICKLHQMEVIRYLYWHISKERRPPPK